MSVRVPVLIIDNDAATRHELAERLRDAGYAPETAADGFKGLGKLADADPDVVLCDAHMPGMPGLGVLREIRARTPAVRVIVMSSHSTIDEAVDAMRHGASDYLPRPIETDRLLSAMEAAAAQARSARISGGHGARAHADTHARILGRHPAMLALVELVQQVAPSKASVLLEGESGTGKGLIAEAIHRASSRASGPFVRLSCAELSGALFESEVFGHEKGSFTGALGRRDGRFQHANGGTLFLDEVSEIPPSAQVKMLRFVQDRAFERVGGNETIQVDVRIVAASNRPLGTMVEQGAFRSDLYYRLNVVPLRVPALRERIDDIPLLTGAFLRRYSQENGRPETGISDDALRMIMAYSWPGNVRELENVIERAVVMCKGQVVEPEHLPAHVVPSTWPRRMPHVPGSSLYDIERWAILETLEHCAGSTSRAASLLGVSPRKIQYKLHEYGAAGRASPASRRSTDANTIKGQPP